MGKFCALESSWLAARLACGGGGAGTCVPLTADEVSEANSVRVAVLALPIGANADWQHGIRF